MSTPNSPHRLISYDSQCDTCGDRSDSELGLLCGRMVDPAGHDDDSPDAVACKGIYRVSDDVSHVMFVWEGYMVTAAVAGPSLDHPGQLIVEATHPVTGDKGFKHLWRADAVAVPPSGPVTGLFGLDAPATSSTATTTAPTQAATSPDIRGQQPQEDRSP